MDFVIVAQCFQLTNNQLLLHERSVPIYVTMQKSCSWSRQIITIIPTYLILWLLILVKQISGEDSCNGSFNYFDRPFHMDFPKLMTNWTLVEKLYGPQAYVYKRESGQIFYINPSNPKQHFVMCLSPKSGSTQYKLILHRILYKDFTKEQLQSVESNWRGFNPLKTMSEKEVKKILSDKSIPRFQIVRNPYIRAISMYESKLQGMNPTTKIYKRGLRYPVDQDITFEQFIERVYDIYGEASTNHQGYNYINKHFQPQSKICKLHLGMSYNYYLRMEQMKNWYDCFVDKVDIREVVSSGWPTKDNCYFSTQKNPCNGPSQSEPALTGSRKPRFSSADRNLERIQRYYKNYTIVQMVNLIYADDFYNYGYHMMAD
eukprot:TRINITY_DN4964_c0_g1_i2.p1 TRINITY_DN4964_c0_g1~~TRINITY_DN4964_c0_g1_i2.p1  ORF type:complete len:373 (+),score=4.57 TRINITY_DN4964_c0_g1_i2:145-1263(+)